MTYSDRERDSVTGPVSRKASGTDLEGEPVERSRADNSGRGAAMAGRSGCQLAIGV